MSGVDRFSRCVVVVVVVYFGCSVSLFLLFFFLFVFLIIRRPPRSTLDRSSAASDVYKRQAYYSQRGDKAGEAVSELVTGYNYELNAVDFSTEKKQAAYLDKSVQSSSKLKMESNSSDAGNGFGDGAPASSNWMAANENIGQSNVSSLQNFYGSRVTATADVQFNMMGDTLFCMDNITGKEKWKYAVSGNLKQEGGCLL